ncbi:MAG TPA: alpha/beta fold hydrolase [Blastocatellia bacterium]|nr:alpha/beta fold hydrolase [Blastocatellia bacterium]
MAKANLAAIIILLGVLTTARAQQQTGKYTMFVGGQIATTEAYTISSQPDGSLKAAAEIDSRGPKQKVTTVAAKDRLVSFTGQVGEAKVISALFDGSKAKLQVAGQAEREVATKATVILENGVWHHFIFLFNQYRAEKAEPQSFTAFLPSKGLDFEVRIERGKPQAYTVKGQTVATERYTIVGPAGIVIDAWTDQSRTPLILVIASQDVKIVLGGAEELAEVALKPQQTSPDVFTSEEVTFQNGEVTLGGTLTLPKREAAARHPAAVIISGSGSQNRDGSGGLLGFYKQIAERLSSNGVAVLRHDDRGVGRSSMPKKPTAYRDLVADTRAAVDYLRARKEIDPDRIMLVGHSEGGTTAVVIASEDQKIAALVLLAGATLANLDKLLMEQTVYQQALERSFNPQDREKYPQIVQWLLARIEEARAGKQDVAPTDLYEYLRQHLSLNLPDAYRRVKCPVLILQGERDALVLPHHAIDAARALAESGNKRVLLRILPNLSHIFAPSPLDGAVEARQKTEISPDVLELIQKWAGETVAAKPGK